MDDTEIVRLGRLAVELGFCTFTEVERAVMQHAANPGSRFTDVLVERRAVTAEQLAELLRLPVPPSPHAGSCADPPGWASASS